MAVLSEQIWAPFPWKPLEPHEEAKFYQDVTDISLNNMSVYH
jgi:hypothetical protein